MRADSTRTVPGTSSPGRVRRVPCFAHVVHLAVAAGVQPAREVRRVGAELDVATPSASKPRARASETSSALSCVEWRGVLRGRFMGARQYNSAP